MIIDVHGHPWPMAVTAYRAFLEAVGGHAGGGRLVVPPQETQKAAGIALASMDEMGTDMQLVSPAPFVLSHSERDTALVHRWIESWNDFLQDFVHLSPDRFRAVFALPQSPFEPIDHCFEEIDTRVESNAFVGVLLNPDPGEGLIDTPLLDDEYWYPLWAKLVECDLPAHIHPAGCRSREYYNEHFITEETIAVAALARSKVFREFPTLRLVCSHGGGAAPYQIRQYNSLHKMRALAGDRDIEAFEIAIRRLYYDTVLWSDEGLELLIKTVGVERCLFATERPGSGTAQGADGVWLDDVKSSVERCSLLSEEDRSQLFEGNARSVFTRLAASN